MAISNPAERNEVIRRAETAFDGKRSTGIKDGFRLRRHDGQQQCSVYWGETNLRQHAYELALSPLLPVGRLSSQEVMEWIESEIERHKARGARRKGANSWPTIGFPSELDYFDFLAQIAELRLNRGTEIPSRPITTVNPEPTSQSSLSKSEQRLAQFRHWLSRHKGSTVTFRRRAERIGQALLRRALLGFWSGSCALTGLATTRLLRASHIKPWAAATDDERLDLHNVLLLAPNVDAAFDAGLMSFTDEGLLIASSQLAREDFDRMGFRDDMTLRQSPSSAQRAYLHWHRENVFRGIDATETL